MAQTTNERIKELRETLGLSLRAFGDAVGYTNPTISLIERGKKQPEKRLLKLICSEFDVNQQWLLTGKGGMFVTREPAQSREEVVTDFIQTILEELSEANRRIVLDAIENLQQEKFFKKRKG